MVATTTSTPQEGNGLILGAVRPSHHRFFARDFAVERHVRAKPVTKVVTGGAGRMYSVPCERAVS